MNLDPADIDIKGCAVGEANEAFYFKIEHKPTGKKVEGECLFKEQDDFKKFLLEKLEEKING